jgi:DsbC/DsbD-like thiol-disulfide interchange protein
MYRFNASWLMWVSCCSALAVTMLVAGQGSGEAAGLPGRAYEAPHTRIRLLTGGMLEQNGTAARLAGIEISMEAGWKTYWRTPGEGIAPSFSWDESANLKDVRVLWPAPIRFSEAGSASIGYAGRVLLPLVITPQDPAKPVSLSLAVAYGVCKDICMPVEAQLSLDMDTPPKPSDREQVLAALDRVPRQQEPGGKSCPHRFLSARMTQGNEGKTQLRVETTFDRLAGGLDLIAEAPQEAGLGAPSPSMARVAGRSAWLFDVPPEGVPALREKPLTFTAVSDQGSCESVSPVE